MTSTVRAKLLRLLSSSDMVRMSSYGCGSRTQLAYRISFQGHNCVYDRKGKKLEGQAVPDDVLIQHVRDVIAELSTYLPSDNNEQQQQT